MSVAEMERRFYELKGKLDVGAIREDEFKAEIEKLRFQDAQNRWWMIGAQSGKWYMYDGTRWIPGQPPEQPPLPPPPAASAAPATPVGVTQPAAATEVAPVQAETIAARPTAAVKQAPIPRAPRPLPGLAVTRRPRPARPPLKFPGRLPILIGCAGVVLLVIVAVFWVAVDNLIPGRPITSTWASLTGGKPSQTVVPGRPTGPTSSSIANANITPLITAGDNFVLQSQFDPAIAQYQAASQMAQSNPIPLTHWSRALAFRGQVQDAVAKAHQAAQRAPNDAEAQAQLARVLAWSGQTAEAVTAGEKAVQIDPKNANGHAYLAEAYLYAKRTADAQTQAQLALQIAPQSAEAHRSQAWALTLTGQKEMALVEWRQMAALEPNLSFRHFEVGEVLRAFYNDPVNAASEYQKAIALNGAYIPAFNRLGLAYIDANLPQQAVPQLQHAITLDPGNAGNYAYLGLAFAKANQCPQAIPYFEQALRTDANNAVAAKGLSDCQNNKPPGAPASPAPGIPLAPPTVPPSMNIAPGAPPPVPGAKPYPGG